MFDLRKAIGELDIQITTDGSTYFYAADINFKYLFDEDRQTVKVAVAETFDRWYNSTDFMFSYPENIGQLVSIIEFLRDQKI